MKKPKRLFCILAACLLSFLAASCSCHACFTRKDTMKPIITLNGDLPTVANEEELVELPAATVSDNKDGDLTGALIITVEALDSEDKFIEKVLEQQGGEACSFMPSLEHSKYKITYSVADAAGNVAKKQVVIELSLKPVGPQDTTPPTITIEGDLPTVADEEQLVELPAATAIDDVDGDVTGSLVILVEGLNAADEFIEKVLEQQGGEACSFMPSLKHRKYRITYFVMDAAGNSAQKQVVIKLKPKPLPDGDLDWDIFL